MDVAVKVMLFQNTDKVTKGKADGHKLCIKQKVLHEAAMCCSMSHPNVVATYNYKVLQASAFHQCPSGLNITDKSDSKAFKLYLIQVRGQGSG